LWLARRYEGTVTDPARVRGGSVETNATRVGPAVVARGTAGIGFGRAAVGLEFEYARGHLQRRPGLLPAVGASLAPAVVRRAWSLTGELRRRHLVLGGSLGLVTTIERTATGNLLLCCDDEGDHSRELSQGPYLLGFSAGYRSELIADALFWELRGRASLAGLNPFTLLWVPLNGWRATSQLHHWVDGGSLGLELALSFN
jgi:hypothetical protein